MYLPMLIPKSLLQKNDHIEDFVQLLFKYKEPIINSFIMVHKHSLGGIYDGRLSNGPIESPKQKVIDLKVPWKGIPQLRALPKLLPLYDMQHLSSERLFRPKPGSVL